MSTHMGKALPYHERPSVTKAFHTVDLPATPVRDHNLPAALWVEAPAELRALGDDLGYDEAPDAMYKRRIGRWLLWRAGPATDSDARYLAIDGDDFARQYSFRIFPDGSGDGLGPDGVRHSRFRAWKEALRDTP